jgi:hypothetical protein
MGVDWHTARFLIAARGSGVEFGRTATLGRQNLFVSKNDLGDLLRKYGVRGYDHHDWPDSPEYADDLFRLLGSKEYVTIDASSYEGASEVHDMNQPIPDRFRRAFDVVMDGGTLEHIFNFPTAIRNCMEMVRGGGHLFLQTPTNNFCGHGFYQFSPELYYRILSPDNGYHIERMVAYEAYPHSPWFEVADPSKIGARVELMGYAHRILLLIHARRVEEKAILAHPPQQSDYAAAWSRAAQSPGEQTPTHRAADPGVLRRLVWSALRRFGVSGKWAAMEREIRFQNRRLDLRAQPSVFRPSHE